MQHFVLDTATGNFWPVPDPLRWCLEQADQPILERARTGLLALTEADQDRLTRLVVRRCPIHFIVVRPDQVRVDYWVKLADLRAFFKQDALARKDVKVALVERKRNVITVTTGAEFLFGLPLPRGFTVEVYREQWDKREVETLDHWQPAPASWTSFVWDGVEPGRIPWGVLKSIWGREKTEDCLNCDRPLLLFGIGWTFSFLNKYPLRRLLCPICRRYFEDHDCWDMEERLVKGLDVRAWPQRHRHRHLILPWTPPTVQP